VSPEEDGATATGRDASGGRLDGPFRTPEVSGLARGSVAVAALVDRVRLDQWSAPTPCEDWTVRRLVDHLTGMNRVFVAVLAGRRPPRPGETPPDPDPAGAFRSSAAELCAAFDLPGVLTQVSAGPRGELRGADRLQIRQYDLLAHGWDLARATGQPVVLPEDLAEQSLQFVRGQLADEDRPGRFAPARAVADDAPAIERLAAYLGRDVDSSSSPRSR
jgi:uncharacterized protein (TIGR03086 family)